MSSEFSGDWRTWYYREGEYSYQTVCRYAASLGFPTVQQLREGALLCTIADAIAMADRGHGARNSWWRGQTYCYDNEQGERWSVAFGENGAVAVFYTNETPRNPFPKGSPPYVQSLYFQGMPTRLEPLKVEALAWMADLDWNAGGPNAVVTTAMWSEGERFTSVDSWE